MNFRHFKQIEVEARSFGRKRLRMTQAGRLKMTWMGGFTLVEVLLALVLLSLAAAGLYAGLSQGIRAERAVRQSDAVYDPLRSFWERFEKDLRNSVYLRSEKVMGKENEIIFPLLVSEEAGKKLGLKRIHYFMKSGTLVRSEEALSNKLVSAGASERPVLKEIKKIKFNYAYLDEDENLKFQPFWMDAPYFGIPKGVQIDIELKNSGHVFSKLISVPQGRWGHMIAENMTHE